MRTLSRTAIFTGAAGSIALTLWAGRHNSVAVFITLATLGLYAWVALGPPRVRTAPIFVIVLPASWLLLVIAVPTAALMSRRQGKSR